MYFDENNNYFDISNEKETIDVDAYTNASMFDNANISFENVIFNRHNDKLFNAEEGFNKGNMFEGIYDKYKNYSYKLRVNNKKDELLYKIQMYSFAVKDLNLYLDLHPTETRALKLFNEYNKELERLKKEYNTMYSPLCVSDVDSNNKWTWINNPWPWDKGGNI